MPVFFKQYRQAKGLTQVDVANALNITYQAYSNYELGKRETDYKTLLKLSELFETSIEALLTGKQATNKEAAPAQFARSDLFEILNGLSDSEIDELKNYTAFLRFKRDHSVSLSSEGV